MVYQRLTALHLVLFVLFGIVLQGSAGMYATVTSSQDVNGTLEIGQVQSRSLRVVKQKKNRRELRWITLEVLFSASEYNGRPMLHPSRVKSDSRNFLYVLDPRLPGVVKFSETGKVVQVYGRGKGKGPGEFQLPFDFSVSRSGTLYVSDAMSGIVSVWDSLGKLTGTIRTRGLPHRIVVGENNGLVVNQGGAGGNPFLRYDAKGNLLSSFGSIFQDNGGPQAYVDVVLTGHRNRLYGAFMRGGHLFAYDAKDSLIYFRESIDGYGLPRFESSEIAADGTKRLMIRPAEDPPLSTLDVSLSDGRIYVLSLNVSTNKRLVIVDVYEEASGDYLFSLQFSKPEQTEGITSLFVRAPFVWTSEIQTDGTPLVRKYRFKFEENR